MSRILYRNNKSVYSAYLNSFYVINYHKRNRVNGRIRVPSYGAQTLQEIILRSTF